MYERFKKNREDKKLIAERKEARQRRKTKIIELINEYYVLQCKELDRDSHGKTGVRFFDGMKKVRRKMVSVSMTGRSNITSIPEEIERRVEYYSTLYSEREGIDESAIIASTDCTKAEKTEDKRGWTIGSDGRLMTRTQPPTSTRETTTEARTTVTQDGETGNAEEEKEINHPGAPDDDILEKGNYKHVIHEEVDWSPPDKEEWMTAVKRQKNRKSPDEGV